MIGFKNYITEMSRKDLHPKYQGVSTSELIKRSKDSRKNSPKEIADLKKEIDLRSQIREESAISGAPGNNTTSGPGMGSDSTLHAKMKKARAFKEIHRRHRVPKKYFNQLATK